MTGKKVGGKADKTQPFRNLKWLASRLTELDLQALDFSIHLIRQPPPRPAPHHLTTSPPRETQLLCEVSFPAQLAFCSSFPHFISHPESPQRRPAQSRSCPHLPHQICPYTQRLQSIFLRTIAPLCASAGTFRIDQVDIALVITNLPDTGDTGTEHTTDQTTIRSHTCSHPSTASPNIASLGPEWPTRWTLRRIIGKLSAVTSDIGGVEGFDSLL